MKPGDQENDANEHGETRPRATHEQKTLRAVLETRVSRLEAGGRKREEESQGEVRASMV